MKSTKHYILEEDVVKAFQNWVATVENAPTIDLKKAKSEWKIKRKLFKRALKKF